MEIIFIKGLIEQLLQLFNGVTWDGDLISKPDRDELIKIGLSDKAGGGFNYITGKGIQYLSDLKLVHC